MKIFNKLAERKELLAIVIWIGFIFDSGGTFGLRIVSGMICGIIIVGLLLRKQRTKFMRLIEPVDLLLFWIWPLFTVCYSLSKGIPVSESNKWIIGLVALIPFVFIANWLGDQSIVAFGKICFVFAVLIVVLHAFLVFGFGFAQSVLSFLESSTPGYFKEKIFEDGSTAPQVYFQTTLLLVPGGIVLAQNKKLTQAIACLLALALSASRSGLIVLLAFLILSNRNWKRLLTVLLGSAFAFWVITQTLGLPILNNLQFLYGDESSGLSIRQGHLNSILREWVQMPIEMWIGAGPGSQFFSDGFSMITDNTEVSQLEIARKFGLPYAVLLCTYYLVNVVLRLKLERRSHIKGLGLAILSYFIVSISNPVLFSLSAMLLFAHLVGQNHTQIWILLWQNPKKGKRDLQAAS